MELPQDIHALLERYLKPKRYILLNKFCRDFYFRKNGLRIKSIGDYEYQNILPFYPIKILKFESITTHDFNIFKKVAEKVVEVSINDKSLHGCSRYLKARIVFPNLKKINCSLFIDDFTVPQIEDLVNLGPLCGTTIKLSTGENFETIKRLAEAGYDFEINWRINREVLDTKICEKVVKTTYLDEIGIKQFPNLACLEIRSPIIDENVLNDIINHPNLRQIENYYLNCIPYNIIKKDGTVIENTIRHDFNYQTNKIQLDFGLYEKAKKHYKYIDISYETLDKITELERSSVSSERIWLRTQGPINYKKILELLELFNIELYTDMNIVKFYISNHKEYKLGEVNPGQASFLFKIGKGKLRIVLCQDHYF